MAECQASFITNENIISYRHSSSLQGKQYREPPNIVVYCGPEKDCTDIFKMVKTYLEQCLNVEAYPVYPLIHEEVTSTPWKDNSVAVVICYNDLDDNTNRNFTEFLLNGGKLISFSSSLEAEFIDRKKLHNQPLVTRFSLSKWQNVCAIQGLYCYTVDSVKKEDVIVDVVVADPESSDSLVVCLTTRSGHGKAIFSQLLLEQDPAKMNLDLDTFVQLQQSNAERLEVLRHLLSFLGLDTSIASPPVFTPCYILVQDQALKRQFLASVAGYMKEDCVSSPNLTLRFVSLCCDPLSMTAAADVLPVVTDCVGDAVEGAKLKYFDAEVYRQHLTSSVLGHVVFFTDVISSTMAVFEGLQTSIPENIGVIAIAGRQTSGRGRGGHAWLSPAGCAMFTLPLCIPVNSVLGQRTSFLKNIPSLAIVHSICTMAGYEELNLCLKWPNDVYYGNKMKVCGVLVNYSLIGDTVHVSIGCGINVSNSQPTICLNDLILQHNLEKGLNLKLLTTSEVIARVVSSIEVLLNQFQEKGPKDFCQLYYKYWLHSGAQVKMKSEGNAELDVQICCLDDLGNLRVISKQGQELTIEPGISSFDLEHNLLTTK